MLAGPTTNSLVLDVVVVLSVLIAVTVWHQVRARKTRHGFPFPPGPPGLPLLGNLFDMPKANEWIAYRDMSRKHGS